MAKKTVESERNSDLRNRAEELLRDGRGNLAGSKADEGRDTQSLVHELQVHQIELEMQNEELKRTKLEAESAMTKYSGLYDFAPIGLFTLSEQGEIKEVNLAGAALLGQGRRNLLDRRFLCFVASEDRLSFNEFCKKAFETSAKQTGEFGLVRDDESTVYAHIECTATNDSLQSVRHCLIAVTDISERKWTEDALRQSQSMLAQAEKIANIGSWEWDVRSGELIWSEQTYRIFGVEPEQSTPSYESFLAYIHPDYRQLVEQAVEDALLGKKPYDIEYQILTPRSTTRWAHSRGEVVFDEIGQPISMVGTVLDITERKLIEIALQESEEKFRLVADFSDDWETWLDPKGNYNYVSPSCERITGHQAEEFIKDPQLAIDIVHPDDREAFKDHRNIHFIEQARRGQINYRIVTKKGETRWISHLCQPVFGRNGEWLGRRASNRDITERKRMEEELRRSKDELEQRVQERTAELEEANKALYSSEQRLLLAQKAGGVGVYDWDIITGEFFCTPVLEKIYGMPAPTDNKVSYDVWLSCVPPEDRPGMQEKMQQIFESEGNELESEYRIIRPEGQERWIASHSLVIRDFDNRPLRIIGTNIDITERKKAEKELMKAKEAAEEAVKVKSAFMANMSHELRTPMNYIVGMTSLLLEEPLTPELKDYVYTIRKGSDEMMALINNILDFTKVEKDSEVLEYQPLSLLALVEESLEMVASKASKKSLNLSFNVNYGTPENIVGDHSRLRQILISLLFNAVKFTDEGDISLSVSSKPLQKTNKHQILFAVKDTGIGIPTEKMTELFQPFAQVETDISLKRDGIGLGLATNKKLVELMGGEIWAKSEVGKGSTFYFTIEAEIAPDDGIKPKPEGMTKAISGSKAIPDVLAEQHPLCILVAEDIPSNQKVLLEMLKRMGYRADAVADGKEVLQALERRPYDLILMDVKMPEMDGIEAAKEIRRRWPNNGPRVIAITAYALHGDKEKCLEAGMDGYIAKPVQKKDLAEVLENLSKRCDIQNNR